ncbi:MAG TPA: hypothetical protein VFJ14_14445, partial [Nocardioidaceae bacterium]|nr:hypothetical protein [Nocardioidaceae bacterium]
LVIHLTVVLVPVTAMTAFVFAAVRRWRWMLRWPLAVLAVGSLVSTGVSVLAGKAFVEARPQLARLVSEHEEAGELLLVCTAVFTVVALVAAGTLGGPTAMASGRGMRRGSSRPVEVGVSALLTVAAAACLYQVVRTGDLGARAVWGG